MHQPLFVLDARLRRLRDSIMSRGGAFVGDFNPYCRDVALWRAMQQPRSVVQVRAAFLRELVALAPIEIPADWTLAGEHLHGLRHCGFRLRGDGDHGRVVELGVSLEQIPQIRQAVQNWEQRKLVPHDVGQPDKQSLLGRCEWFNKNGVFMAGGWVENHSVRDFAKVVRIGFGGIREQIQHAMRGADLSAGDYARKENFWQAALSICDAGILLGQRYAELAARTAAEASEAGQRQRLLQMAQVCQRVPERGARTFFEAAQALWLAHILTCGEDFINANSIGRVDQILWPYYQADRDAGVLSRAQATTIMAELACKLYLDYDVQAIVLGGVDAHGQEAVNELSYVILDATEAVEFVRDVSVRLRPGSPQPFIQRCAELIARGGGIPFIFNDDCFVRALADRGIALADARDYAPIGCIELTIPGKANPHAVSGWFNAAKCLELALYGGRELRSGQQWGPATKPLDQHADFESFYAAYSAQVDCMARRMVYHCNRGELDQREHGPLPCWSVLTDRCIERGRDITDGGAEYCYHSICFMGAANVADSLAAVRQLVFEQKRVVPQDLLQALQSNFEGSEVLRQLLLKAAPKYGNDQAGADELAGRVCQDFIRLMDTMRSSMGSRYFVHLFTWRLNVDFGKSVGATPDGRRGGEPLAYSLSAHQGRDEKGVTAMLRSLSRLPHSQAAGASAAIIDLDPVLVKGPDLLTRLITGAMEMGVGQIQWNVVSAERLRMAQQDPERYGNIAVRVAGYSQMFRLIDRELQEHLIARTKHRS
jgi:formate C-acetyltransferase